MEGTENGLQKYEKRNAQKPLLVPVLSVARSRLKYPENYLVGVSIVHSIESILRDQQQVLQWSRAGVLGFGRVGRAVATTLRGRGVPTMVHDIDEIALAEAAAQGFPVFTDKNELFARSSLVVCATGSGSMNRADFENLDTGTYVATVTSKDDEFGAEGLAALADYGKMQISERMNLWKYYSGRHYFNLMNNGNTVNFLHSGVIGPAIQLIEGEKLACIAAIRDQTRPAGIGDVGDADRRKIAKIWLNQYSSELAR